MTSAPDACAIRELPLRFETSADVTVEQVRAITMQVAEDMPVFQRVQLGLVVVDYVQRMPLPKMYGSASTTDRIGEISNRLTDMAATEEVAFVLCSQLNREIEKRGADDARPKLSDIRGSGSLEQDGKLILGLYRDDPSSSKLEILVLKNHNGAAGTMAEAFWHLPTHTICNHPGDLPWLPGRD